MTQYIDLSFWQRWNYQTGKYLVPLVCALLMIGRYSNNKLYVLFIGIIFVIWLPIYWKVCRKLEDE